MNTINLAKHGGIYAMLALLLTALSTPPADGEQPPRGFQSGFAPVNGLRIYYEIHGPDGGALPPILLLHGGGSTIETTFGRVLPLFEKTRRVIAFEQQGHGRTADIIDRPFTFEQSADDTAGLLDHLGIERADFFGFSNGGNIALQVAIRHPSRVHKLVVASAMFRRDGLYPELWEFMKGATLENMPQILKEAYLQFAPHPERLRLFHDKCAKRMLEFQDWPPEAIQSIEAPTLIIIGDVDSVRPEHAVEMFRLLPHARLAVLPGGHGAYIGEATAARLQDSRVEFDVANVPEKDQRGIPELAVAMIAEFLDAPMPTTQ